MDKIFGTDGIRAIAGEFPLTPAEVERIGYFAGKVCAGKMRGMMAGTPPEFLLGRDTRISSPWIERSLSRGLARANVKVLTCGEIPTSAISALLIEGNYLGGAVISASHNPAQFNGIKFFSKSGKKIPDSWEREIEKFLKESHSYTYKKKSHPKPQKFLSVGGLYMDFIKKSVSNSFRMNDILWVLDCANGASSKIAPMLFESFGADVLPIHDRPNGLNINLNCGALHLESLRKAVLKHKAFGGCAFDGDADRVLFVDEKGRIMDGDVLLALEACAMKSRGDLKKNRVVSTVMANLGFFKTMEKAGIRVITTAVGDRNVSNAMERSGAILGGEQSGHIIFRKHLPTGDGLLTALKILESVLSAGKKLSYFTDSLAKFPQILVNVKVKKRIPLENCPEIQSALRTARSGLDGNGRVLVRFSGTEPLLRIMVEGESLSKIKKTARMISQVAQEHLQ